MSDKTPQTPQEIFDFVATHLFTQGTAAVNKSGACRYRGPDGTKCAVGALIPDDEYSVKMEGKSSLEVGRQGVSYHSPTLARLNEKDPGISYLLRRLQTVHDSIERWASTEAMREDLARVAELNHLDDSILKTLSFKDR